MKICETGVSSSVLLFLVLSIVSSSTYGKESGEVDNKKCTPLSKQYPELGTDQSISAKNKFTTVWGSFELPGPPCGYGSAEEHYNALLKDVRSRSGPTRHTPLTLPDWSGHWGTDIGTGEIAIGGINSHMEGVIARLAPAARKVFERDLKMWKANQAIDPVALCLPPHFPRWFTVYGYREHFLTPDKSLLGVEMVNEFRRVFTDGRGHPSPEWMTTEWMGYSIGFWDGDILTVWTRSIKEGIMTRGMPRTSNKMEIVERWRKVNPVTAGIDVKPKTMGASYIPEERIEIEVTLYDPGFVEPWHTVVAFYKEDDRTPQLKQQVWPHVWDCVGGSRWYITEEGVVSEYAPDEKPDITNPDFWFNEKYIFK